MPVHVSLYYIKEMRFTLAHLQSLGKKEKKTMNDALTTSRAGNPRAGHLLTLDPSSASKHLTPDPPSTDDHLAPPLRRPPPHVALHKSLKKMVREVVHGT
jgi:hypothetical protein